MLVLTRKQGEQIRIGSDIVITVVRTKGKAVRLGIQAPAQVPVLRGEIAAAIANDEKNKTEGQEHEDEPWPASEAPSVAEMAFAAPPTTSVHLVKLGRSPLRDLLAAHAT